jgi:diaminohydroxyphosphoribosylaminopyrimidine deaminase/5-amino-6-(5-phosphoribosylamino)uracil reductase
LLRTPPHARAIADAPAGSTIVLHAADAEPARKVALRERGALLYAVPRAGTGLDLEQALRVLAREGVVRVLAEGGPTLQRSLLAGGLIDQIAVESQCQ